MKLNNRSRKNYDRRFADKITDLSGAEEEQGDEALTEEEFNTYYVDWP